MANIKAIILVLIASIMSVACAQQPERTIKFKGEWPEDKKALVMDAMKQWCDKTGDCVTVDSDSPNYILLTEEDVWCPGINHPVAGCTTIHKNLGTGEVETYIKINVDESGSKAFTGTVAHEFGHMLTGDFSHVEDKNSVMYYMENSVDAVSDADTEWYFEHTKMM